MQSNSVFTPSFLRTLTQRVLLCTALGATVAGGAHAAQSAHQASAQGPLPAASRATGLAHQCERADLIFEGVVESIRYRNSDVRSGHDLSLPHTYVTFRVADTYKGRIAGSTDGTFTLRFLGGPDGTGRVLHVSHAPEFEVGSREILLVQNSEVWGIPLVNGNERRFRLQDGKALSESGMPLEFVRGGVRVRPIDKANEEALSFEQGRSLQADVFRNTLRNLIAGVRSARDFQPAGPVAPVVSVAFEAPFYVPAIRETAPRVLPGDLVDPVQPEELEESQR